MKKHRVGKVKYIRKVGSTIVSYLNLRVFCFKSPKAAASSSFQVNSPPANFDFCFCFCLLIFSFSFFFFLFYFLFSSSSSTLFLNCFSIILAASSSGFSNFFAMRNKVFARSTLYFAIAEYIRLLDWVLPTGTLPDCLEISLRFL